jgi:ubiquinone/menaquinone biosynthesis C-methylase UbiE
MRDSGLVESVFDRAARTYGSVGTDFFRRTAERLTQDLSFESGTVCVDVGAGTGAVTFPMAQRLFPDGFVLAVDRSAQMLDQLRARVSGLAGCPTAPVVMDAGALGIRTGCADVVVSSLAMPFFDDPVGALREMRRVLRPRGRLAVSTSPGWWWQEDHRWDWHAKLLHDLGVGIEPPLPSTGPAALLSWCASAGFTDITTESQSFAITWISVNEFWAWCWSHGWRGVLESMTDTDASFYEASCRRHLGQPESLMGRVTVSFATARSGG